MFQKRVTVFAVVTLVHSIWSVPTALGQTEGTAMPDADELRELAESMGVYSSDPNSSKVSKHFCSTNDINAAWAEYTDKVTKTARRVVMLERCKDCEITKRNELQELWGRIMYRYARMLKCSLNSKNEKKQTAAREELIRVFSGSVMANVGSTAAVIPFLEQADEQGIKDFRDAIEIYKRLKDPKTRKDFLDELKKYGDSGKAISKPLLDDNGNPLTDTDLLDVLLNAERGYLATALATIQEYDVQSRRMTRVLRGLQIVVEKGWEDSKEKTYEQAGEGFVSALLQLLKLLTADFVLDPKTLYKSDDGFKDALCGCTAEKGCTGVLHIQLDQAQDDQNEIQPVGALYFESDIYDMCLTDASTKKQTPITSPAFSAGCNDDTDDTRCRINWAGAATKFMNSLSMEYSIFGNVAFLAVDREVDTISATFHEGVRVNDLPGEAHARFPKIVEAGLSIDNVDCEDALYESVYKKLEDYNTYIGKVSKSESKMYPRLRLTSSKENECELALFEEKGDPIYNVNVKYNAPASPKEAGIDAGSVVGQLYMKLYMTRLITTDKGMCAAPPNRDISPLRSLLFSGLPHLSDDNHRNDVAGWTFGSVESAGWLLGGAFLIPSIVARNKFDNGVEGAFDRSRTYLGITYGAIALSLTMRLVSLAHYGIQKYRRSKKKNE